MKKAKWMALGLLLAGGTLFANGCLAAFWQGMWSKGWPGNRWLNLLIDVANEMILG